MPDATLVKAIIEALPVEVFSALLAGISVLGICLWFIRGYLIGRDKHDAEERARVFDQWSELESRREERHAKQIEVLESLKVTNDRVVRVLEHCERQTSRRFGQ